MKIFYITFLLILSNIFAQSYQEIIDYCKIVSDYYKIPQELLPAIIRVESDFRPYAVSHKMAYGLMQVTECVYIDYKRRNPKSRYTSFEQVKNDWRCNIWLGAWYLKRVCYAEKGNWKDAITAYNWGPWHPSPGEKYYNKVTEKSSK